MTKGKRWGLCFFFFLLSAGPSIGGPGETKRIIFEQGQFSIVDPTGTRFYPPDRLLGPDWDMVIRLTRHNEYDTLEKQVEKILAFDRLLAGTVKQSEYHALVSRNPFSGSGDIRGFRCIFGYKDDAVCRLSYFFVTRNKDMVEINIRFSSQQTRSQWMAMDEKIVNTLRLE